MGTGLAASLFAVATAADFQQGVDCSGAACPSICGCANDKCASQVSACLADSACASAQDCVLACGCGDTACAAACAAGAGSLARSAGQVCLVQQQLATCL